MAKAILKIKKAYDKEPGKTVDTGKGLTEQAHKDQCDINLILKDYKKTGLIRHAAKHAGKYDDVTVTDFQEAMFIVKNAQNMFMDLPSETRKRFGNDPGQFLEFVQKPENSHELQQMGIIAGNDGIDMRGAASGAPQKPAKVEAAPDSLHAQPEGS